MPTWKRRGACATRPVLEMDLLFFPPDDERPSKARYARETAAKKICSQCPVRMKCLAYALETGQTGIWGETTDDERKKIKRVGHRVKCPHCGGKDIFQDEHGTAEICIKCGVTRLVRAHVSV